MEYQLEKIRYISHEIKNQLSICDLYTEILQKYCDKSGIEDETIKKSVNSIKRAIQIAGVSLTELKSSDSLVIEEFSLNAILKESYELSKVYGISKGIHIELELKEDYCIRVDKNKLEGVIINLVKNACEAFTDDIQNKIIKIFTKKEDNVLNIIVSNNAHPIQNKEEIFTEGYATKQTGTGLGLYICQKNLEEISGRLKLLKSDNISTDFTVQLKI